jgi:uncharacterized membrane protein
MNKMIIGVLFIFLGSIFLYMDLFNENDKDKHFPLYLRVIKSSVIIFVGFVVFMLGYLGK